jgi:hypothetical protein
VGADVVGADVVGADVVGADVGAEVVGGEVGAEVGADVGSLHRPSAAISSTVLFMDFMRQQKTPPFATSS